MPKEKDLKRLVRARMRKTGESYTAARAMLRSRKDAGGEKSPDLAARAGMSDAAVRAKTGRDWAGWKRALDAIRAHELSHRDIARCLRMDFELPPWWSQTVAVGYERIRGLRDRGQVRGGGYRVGKSKTVPVPVAALYAAFGARRRARWLGDARVAVKKAVPGKSMRLAWEDGTPIEVTFLEKGPSKSQVQLVHAELASRADADRLRAFWAERLAALADHLVTRERS